MKNVKTIIAVLCMVMVYTASNAQGNCQGGNIKVYRGANGCGCHCDKECVTPAELPEYLENGWNTVGCWNCCKFKNWVDAARTKTSLDAVHPGEESGSLAIAFTLASAGNVKIKIMDVIGRYITTIVDEYREDINNELIWDNTVLIPGMYMLSLEAGDYRETKVISIAK